MKLISDKDNEWNPFYFFIENVFSFYINRLANKTINKLKQLLSCVKHFFSKVFFKK